MRIRKYLILILIHLVCANNVFSGFISSTNSKTQTDLDEILKKCAEYCKKVESSALFFVCKEKIKEKIFSKYSIRRTVSEGGQSRIYGIQTKKEKNEYVYDYQLIKKGKNIKESRTLIEENGEKKHEKDAPLKTKKFYSLKSVYGPVGLLSDKFQALYNYKLLKEDKISGRKAYVIESSPKRKIKENPNFGKLWVDKEDFSVLKIEMAQESLVGFEELERKYKWRGVKPILTTIHRYEVEKNGIRFPSRTVFEEAYGGSRIVKTRHSRTIIEYYDYRFFTVDVEVKYK